MMRLCRRALTIFVCTRSGLYNYSTHCTYTSSNWETMDAHSVLERIGSYLLPRLELVLYASLSLSLTAARTIVATVKDLRGDFGHLSLDPLIVVQFGKVLDPMVAEDGHYGH